MINKDVQLIDIGQDLREDDVWIALMYDRAYVIACKTLNKYVLSLGVSIAGVFTVCINIPGDVKFQVFKSFEQALNAFQHVGCLFDFERPSDDVMIWFVEKVANINIEKIDISRMVMEKN